MKPIARLLPTYLKSPILNSMIKYAPSFKFVINYMEHMLLLLFLATGQSVAADMMNHLLLDCQMTDISSQVMCLDFCNTPIKLFF